MSEPSQTSTSIVRLRDDGIIHVRVFPGVHQSAEDAAANLAAATAASQGRKRPILVDITGCEPLEPHVRRVYTGDGLKAFSAIAMLVDATTFGRMIGNIYLQIASPGVPAHLFQKERDALAWLMGHLA